jgi:hypothetical protein
MYQQIPFLDYCPIRKSFSAWRLLSAFILLPSILQAAPVTDAAITEFVPDNKNGLVDADGVTSDWIEIFNSSGAPGDLGGYYLTDDPLILTKWQLPAATFNAEGYAVIFASGKNRIDPAAELHTSFKLSSTAGSYLALVKPDGVTIATQFVDYPVQYEDVSYGTNTGVGYFTTPTPGSVNGTKVDGLVADTQFSSDRGFYDTGFDLTISTLTPNAEIRYTLNGSAPSETSGLIYTTPFTISATTVVRAMAHRPGFEPTNIDTHSYIFPQNVLTQPKMRTAITASALYGPQMIDSLKAVPTISLVTQNTAFENETGANIRDEFASSIEMIFPDGTKGFQENAGLSNYGGRFTNFNKKSFRVAFRSEFGKTKLNYPIFDGFDYPNFPPTEKFDAIDLRSGSHDMVSRGAYMSNRFIDDTLMEMGNVAPHGRFVHVYLNGKYWGQYHMRERWSADMASSYYGGPKDEYEAINANNTGSNFEIGIPSDGTGAQWTATQGVVNGADPFANAAGHIDIPNVIDFMLLWVSGNSESEFRSFGSVPLGVPFKFNMKDADGFLRAPTHPVNHQGPLDVMTKLKNGGNPDYAVLLADRIHKHFFNDGAFTPAKNIARLQRRVNEARLGFLSEAARWGNLYREPAAWESYQTNLIYNHFPTLTAGRIAAFKTAGMYPDSIAPVFNQHGGSIASGAGITMATNTTAIYYTLDGTDPRQSGGAINPAATLAPFSGNVPTPQDFITTGYTWKYLDDGSDQGSAWRASVYDDSAWLSGPSLLGYGDSPATTVGFIDTNPAQAGNQRNATTYFRTTVSISNPADYSYFIIRLRYDDGAAIYANGTKVVRTINLPANAAFNDFTTTSTPDEKVFFDFQVPSSSFVDGLNTLAAEIHNASSGSGDIGFDMFLRGEVDNNGADNVTLPVILNQPTLLRARALNTSTGEWSALNEAFFSINTVPADASNLVLSELHYHPAEPTTPDELAVSTDRDDYEFAEFLNIGTTPIDLSGVQFTSGINFAFPDNTLLDPGQRLVIARDLAAFTARYGSVPTQKVVATYTGRFSNSGETITVNSIVTGAITTFAYTDLAPWPTLTDGGGPSLVFTGVDATDPAAWGIHTINGGAPGEPDTVVTGGYALWKNTNNITNDTGDKDDDGIANLAEYAFGTDPQNSTSVVAPAPSLSTVATADYLTIEYQKNLSATDVQISIQKSTDLATWVIDETLITISDTPNPGGETSKVILRSSATVTDDTEVFFRVLVSL